MAKIPVTGPSITQKEIEYVADAAARAWYESANLYNTRFEQSFADFLGVTHAVTLPSCTAAIHLALLALGVGPGDEVIVPEATWIATAAPISYVGATTVFADIDADTWCLSDKSFAECITSKTKAVIPVDLYGNMPRMDRLLEVARLHGVAVIEDAAQAVGAEYKGCPAGSLGDIGVFSFHGSKTLTTGEGGMLVTDSEEIWRRVLFLRDHGRQQGGPHFWNLEVAYKYKMSSMQAALGLAQLERLDELIELKRQIFEWYNLHLDGVEGVSLNPILSGTRNAFWMVTIVLDPCLGLTKDRLANLLEAEDIDSRPFFFPLSSLPAYYETEQARYGRARNLVSYSLSPYGLNLPSALNLKEEQVIYVCDALKRALRDSSQSCRNP